MRRTLRATPKNVKAVLGELTEQKASELKGILSLYSREPFIDVVSKLLACEPSIDAIRAFAEKSPDRWAQAITLFAKLAGFTEDVMHVHGNLGDISKLSDAELHQRLSVLRARALPPMKLIEAKPDDKVVSRVAARGVSDAD